jgi:MFS family permease
MKGLSSFCTGLGLMNSEEPSSHLAPMPLSPLRRNLRYCSYDALVGTPFCFLLQPGNFIIAALLVSVFKLTPAVYGLISALPFLANFAQVFLMPLISRSYSAKTISVTMVFLQALCWLTMAALMPLLPIDNPEISGKWWIALFLISAVLSSMAGVSWISWIREWVPQGLLGKYFGLRNRLAQFSQISFLLITGWLINRLSNSILAFQFILVVSCLLRLVSGWYQWKTSTETSIHSHPRTSLNWRDQLAVLLQTKPCLWFIAYSAAWGFAASLFSPFVSIFMYEELNLSVQQVSTIVIVASVGGAVSASAWGKLADRFGNKPVMLFCMILWQAQNFLWCIVSPANHWILYPMWVFGGVMGAGFTLTLFNLQLKIIPAQAKTLAISVNIAVGSLLTAVGPILGGKILEWALSGNTPAIDVYHRVFFFTPVLSLLACLLLIRVRESSASPLSSVVGAMRNIRTLSSIFGASFLADYMFVKTQKRTTPTSRS